MKIDIISNVAKGMPLVQYIAMLTGTLNVVSSGMHYGWSSPSLPQLLQSNSSIAITGDEGSWISVMPPFGSVIGNSLGAIVVDVIGRKRVILLASLPFFATWIMVAFANSLEMFLAGRFIAGIADGMVFCATPIYMGEIADPKIRGLLGSSVPVAWMLGTLLINIIGSYLSIRTSALIASVIPLIGLITFYWIPESPYYLLMKNLKDDAEKSLKIFNGTEDIQNDLKRMTDSVRADQENKKGCLDLFTSKSNRNALFVSLVAHVVQQLIGVSAIMFYAYTIFHEADEIIPTKVAVIIYFSIQFIMCVCCSAIVDKTGRRPLFIFSIIGSGSALLVEGIYFYLKNMTDIDITAYNWIPIFALIVFVITYNIGTQPIPILMLGELFPTNVKGLATCLSNVSFGLTSVVVSKFFQITKDAYGLYVPFFVFAGCAVVGLGCIVVYMPETKGKTLEQIQLELKGKMVTFSAKNNEESK